MTGKASQRRMGRYRVVRNVGSMWVVRAIPQSSHAGVEGELRSGAHWAASGLGGQMLGCVLIPTCPFSSSAAGFATFFSTKEFLVLAF